MRLLTGLYIGRESLMSHGAAIAVTADNISNVNTTAYKNKRGEFATLLAEGQGNIYSSPLPSSSGVSVDDVYTIHDQQGPIEQTERPLDVAIDGSGFFLVKDGPATEAADNSNTHYTRAGVFTADQDGYVVDPDGEYLLGYTAQSPDTPVPINAKATEGVAVPTTTVTVGGNLSAQAPVLTEAPDTTTFASINAASAFSSSIRVIDSLGVAHEVGLQFFHTAAGSWTAAAFVDGADVGGTAGTPTQLGSTTISFDPTGVQGTGAATTISISPTWANGGNSTATVDLSNMTQLGASSQITSQTGDGRPAGSVVGFRVERDGTLLAILDNEEEFSIATIPLAKFVNPNGLRAAGDNKYVYEDEAGDKKIGVPDTEGRGFLRGNSLERSAVDLSKQFVNIIQLQRGYQAGSQVISTVNDMLNTTIQMA